MDITIKELEKVIRNIQKYAEEIEEFTKDNINDVSESATIIGLSCSSDEALGMIKKLREKSSDESKIKYFIWDNADGYKYPKLEKVKDLIKPLEEIQKKGKEASRFLEILVSKL